MCGISGFVRKSKHYISGTSAVLEDMTYYQRLRGLDSLGMAKISFSGQSKTIRRVGDPGNLLFSDKETKDFLWGSPGDQQYYIIHNRHATRGDKDNVNHAHPFTEEKHNKNGNIILVHNGTLTHIRDPYDKKYAGETDSHSLTKMIAAGIPLGEIDANIFGAWACVWYDSEDRTMNFWRNKERPFGFIETKDAFWFGSELYAMAAALDRRDIKIEQLNRFTVGEHWKYHHDSTSWTKREVKPKVRVVPKSIREKFEEVEKELIQEDSKRLAPPATGGAPPSCSTQSRTSCVPWEENAASSPIINPSSATVSRSSFVGRNYHTAPKRKRTIKINSAIGFSVGDIVYFCAAHVESTQQPAQTRLSGYLVTFNKKGNANASFNHEVKGMIGEERDKVAAFTNLFTGKIVEIHMPEGTNDKNEFLFIVKNIALSEIEDNFSRWAQLIEKTAQNEEKGEVEKEQAKKSKGILLTQTPPSSEKEKSLDSSVTLRLCNDCKINFPVNMLNPIRKAEDEEDSLRTIFLCRECLVSCLKDNGRLDNVIRGVNFFSSDEKTDAQLVSNIVH